MALPDLTGQNIENTYQRIVQTDGTNFYDGTGSLVILPSANTASLLTTASAVGNTITFTKGNASQFSITVDTGSGGTIDTSSLVTTSSFNAFTSSINQFTSSYNTGSFTGSFTGSLLGTASYATTASYALNGGVTQLLAGSNISLSPTNGLGQVTITSTGGGGVYGNTATGSYGSFYDTTTQTNPIGNIPRSMSLNSTDITNGVSISGSTSPFNTYIKTENAGVYNIQFSAQIDKTDSGTDEIVIWLRKNGIDLTDTATTITTVGNNAKYVAAWNWFVTSAANDYYQIIWISADTGMRLLAETISGTHPGIPSVIVTANRVDQFLSNTGSFSGSFTGVFTGSLLGTASWAVNALTASFAPNYVLTSTTSSMLAPYVLNSQTSSFVQNSQTSSFVLNSQTSSMTVLSSSFASTASYTPNAIVTASATPGAYTIRLTKGNGTFFDVALTQPAPIPFPTTDTGSFFKNAVLGGDLYGNDKIVFTRGDNSTLLLSLTSSYVLISQTSSFVQNSQTSSFVNNNQTSSFVLNSQTGSFITNNQTSSMLEPYVLTSVTSSMLAPYVLNSQTSSFVQNSQTSSFVNNNQTSSFVQNSQTSSFVQNSQTSSFVNNNQTSSFVQNSQTSSFVLNSQTSSMTVLSSSFAITASYISTPQFSSVVELGGTLTITNANYNTYLGKTIILTGSSAKNFTLNYSPVSPGLGDEFYVIQSGSGRVTASGSGVTLLSSTGSLPSTRTEYSSMAIKHIGSNRWIIVGDIT